MVDMETLRVRLAGVRETLKTSAEAGGWPMPELVVVTKTHPLEEILPLRELGVTCVGENRVQELQEKQPLLAENFQVHLIGRLQTNKVKYIMKGVSMVQSVDRWNLAEEIDRQAQRQGVRMPVLIQISPVGEPQKGGLPREETERFLREASRLDGLEIRGLMAVMPDWREEAPLLEEFRRMRELFDQMRETAPGGVRLRELSMGMSGDYPLAARCGATMVRVGSAILGPRTAQ